MPFLVHLFLAAATASVAPGAADPSEDAAVVPEPAPATRVLLLSSRSPSDAEPGLFEAIEEQGRGLGLQMEVVPASEEAPLARAIELSRSTGALGVFWLSATNRGLAIYLYEPGSKGVFVREIERASGETDAAIVEAVSLAVASTAAALRQGSDLFMTPLDAEQLAELLEAKEPTPAAPAEPVEASPEPESPEPREPVPAADETAGIAVRLSAAYLGDGFNEETPWQSGAQLGVSVLPHRLVRVGLSYGFLAPSVVGRNPTVRLTRHEIAAEVGVGGAVSRRVELHGLAVAAVNLGVWESATESGLRPLARVGPTFALGVRLVRGLFFDLGVGAMVGLNRAEFVLCDAADQTCDADNRRIVGRSWPVAPRATAGLSYRFDGLGRGR